MLEQTAAAVEAAEGPVALVGSSLGAFVALHAAAADPSQKVDRLVLLAPAVDFGGNRLRQLGDQGIAEWRERGSLRVFHYAANEEREVGFALYEDAAQFDAHAVTLRQPALVFQGQHDSSVDPRMVEAWADGRPGVELTMLDDDHQLVASIDLIWHASAAFFGVGDRRP